MPSITWTNQAVAGNKIQTVTKVSSEPSEAKKIAPSVKVSRVICRVDRISDWSGCERGSRDVACPGESSGMGTGEGKHEPPLNQTFNHFPEKENPELGFGEIPLQLESGPPLKGWAGGQKQRGVSREVA